MKANFKTRRSRTSWVIGILVRIGVIFAIPCVINAQINNADKSAPVNGGITVTASPNGNDASKPAAEDLKAIKTVTKDNLDLSSVAVTKVDGSLKLFDTITVTVHDLSKLLEAAQNDYSKIILYIDGYPLKGITPRQGDNIDELKFDIRRTDDVDTKKSWDSLLGKPVLPIPEKKKVSVKVGLEGKPLNTTVNKYDMTVIKPIGYWIYVASVLLFTMLFIRWARKSELLRVGPNFKDPITGQSHFQSYSLGRCQMAYWFFIVAASYMFIWMVTSESRVLPGSVLGLIGISAATALGAMIIDNTGTGNIPTSVIPEPTAGFFNDIFSDDQGQISFHRFQIFVWSIVMGIIFIAAVYHVLTMPDFPGELLALMGISSGTYIGFKFPEKQQAQNKATAIAAMAVIEKANAPDHVPAADQPLPVPAAPTPPSPVVI